MSRKLFIAGNWKMNHTNAVAKEVLADLKAQVAGVTTVDIAICPTFTTLPTALEVLEGSNIAVGAQNVHFAANGAYTGEISAEMLNELNVPFVIIGHSERRQYFAETDETVNQRTKAALAAGIKPIVCVGETLEERQAGDTIKVVETQIKGAFEGISEAELANITIAYEPVWAIGTGETATPQQAQDVHAEIRKLVAALYTQAAADAIIIQYGGSVKPGNVVELMGQEDIDGALVGGASLKADDFAALVNNVA
ncbi:MAG: triose-phosphate isomerase [Crocinitomicaceae bacterium]|nr:triose-phosphate isomerase [Crocinitomicaceae bacterium]